MNKTEILSDIYQCYIFQFILTTQLGVKRVSERWVPRAWTPETRQCRIKVCQQLLSLYKSEGHTFLKRILVGDTSYVMRYTPESARPQKVVRYRPAIEPETVYCAFFYDMEGLVLAEPLDGPGPLTEPQYADYLRKNVMPAYKRKRGTPEGQLFLLHRSCPETNGPRVRSALQDLAVIPLPSVPASPDLEPFEYWLYRSLKTGVGEPQCTNRLDMWSAVQKHLHAITDLEFNNSIFRLVDRWQENVDKGGLYIL